LPKCGEIHITQNLVYFCIFEDLKYNKIKNDTTYKHRRINRFLQSMNTQKDYKESARNVIYIDNER